MNKRRVMVLCGQAPWPRNGGALLRNYWMIDALRKAYAVDLVVADETAPIPPEFAAMVDDYACFPRGASERGGLKRLLRAALPGESSLTAGWTNAALRDYVSDRLGRYPYAAIQADLSMQAALPRRDTIPIVYNAHNCESALLTRRAKTEPPHLAAALLFDAGRVRRLERSLIERASLVAACAEQDILDFEKIVRSIRAKAAIVPNGVDVDRYRSIGGVPSEPCTVLISGSMDWRPNILGLRWFLRSVLPELRTALPHVVVRVAGRMESPLAAELREISNVDVVPNPQAMDPHLGAATVVVAPIIASSGTRLRILEAWAAERAVLTTTPGAFGLTCTSGVELMVRDEADAFTHALVRMLQTPKMRDTLVSQAAKRVKEYDWWRVGVDLRLAYERFTPERGNEIAPAIREKITLSAAV